MRILATAVTMLLIVLIASYYLFGGPLKISLFFPAPTFYESRYLRIPTMPPDTPGPVLLPAPKPLPSPSKPPRPSMKTPTKTDVLVHMSPAPYRPMPINLVTPLPGPTYAPVTPPPFTPSKPVVTLPQPGGVPSPSPTP
jgi:hypothetical protein